MELNGLSQPGLVELLDRVLDRGVVIYADVIISLAGVPLIALNLRTALAGVETMAKYMDIPLPSPAPMAQTGV